MLIEFSTREEAELLYNIATPAGVYLLQFDTSSKSYIMGTVEDMIEMPPGVPFVVNIDGDESHSITVACLQTLDSLQGYSKYPTNTLRLKSLFLFQLRIYGLLHLWNLLEGQDGDLISEDSNCLDFYEAENFFLQICP